MIKRLLFALFALTTITSAVALALSVPGTFQDRFENKRDGDEDHQGNDDDRRGRGHDRHGHDGDQQSGVRLATGQFVTPTAIEDSVQMYLNPQLPGYPD